MSQISSLGGQVALVTGASSGIGRAIAIALAKQGMDLCLVGRNGEELKTVARLARSADVRLLSCPTDLTRDEDVRKMQARFLDKFQRLDVLVHSAGLIAAETVARAPIHDFDVQWQTNVRSAYLISQLLLPQLEMKKGQIVFINSSLGITARGGLGQYAATKHALKAIADSLRDEVNVVGIRVLSVFLGRTATRMQEMIHSLEGKQYFPELLLQPEDVAETVLGALRISRTAEVTDIHIRPMQKPAAKNGQ